MSPPHDVTRLLIEWSHGDSSALDRLAPLVYDELHSLAARYLRAERVDHTLQPTALVHEAYVKLIQNPQPEWDSRGHFFAFAARLMRQVLVDYARRHGAAKRESGDRVPLEQVTIVAPERFAGMLALDEALTALASFDERKVRLVELRYFSGMRVDETARAMNLSVATVRRELRLAEAWLHRAMDGELGAHA